MSGGLRFHLYLPQMRMSLADMTARARVAEASGFEGIALMDHLSPPAAPDQPMYEALTAATWLAAQSSRLVVGHLVLCDAFRHPAVLARQAVTLSDASGGRFELGLGSGSVPEELAAFGVSTLSGPERSGRLRETLEVLTRLWRGESVSYAGEHFSLSEARQLPVPSHPIPILLGGTGPRTMELVAEFAQWWNVPTHQADRLEAMRPRAGGARVSVQQMVTFVPDPSVRDEIEAAAARRFGWMGGSRVVGSGEELVEHFARVRDSGVERVYAWFSDFAHVETLAAFGEQVIAHF
jgi:alkanesulfonate monooxygenase SsuD/methylene tetrahydromethanopterin reductase-like flavin-dependent oxidoreductase (luciferase family)